MRNEVDDLVDLMEDFSVAQWEIRLKHWNHPGLTLVCAVFSTRVEDRQSVVDNLVEYFDKNLEKVDSVLVGTARASVYLSEEALSRFSTAISNLKRKKLVKPIILVGPDEIMKAYSDVWVD